MSEYRLSSIEPLPGSCDPGVSIWPARVYRSWPLALSSIGKSLPKKLEVAQPLLSSCVRFLPNRGMGVLVVMDVLSESKEPVDLERLKVEVVGEVGGRNISALRAVEDVVGSERWHAPDMWNWDMYAIPYRSSIGIVDKRCLGFPRPFKVLNR